MTDEPNTLHQRALADFELEAQGRFGARARPQINGSQPIVAPPPVPLAWQTQWPDDRAQFGIDIEAVPDMTIVESG